MANANALVYGHYSDNVAPSATIAIQTGTAASGYAAANIADRNPAKPSNLNETTGAWTFAYGSAQRVDWVALLMHNLTAGLNVRIQGNATNVWGAPTFDQAITIPAYRDDGFPVPSWLDLTGLSGYSAAGFLFWRFVVVGVNAAAIKIGEFAMMSRKRTLDPNISWGTHQVEERKIIEHQTDYGVSTVYDLGVTRRSWAGDLDGDDTQRANVQTWWRDARGRSQPFVIVPDGTVNDCAMVRFGDTKLDYQLAMFGRNTLQVGFEEVSRGLVL